MTAAMNVEWGGRRWFKDANGYWVCTTCDGPLGHQPLLHREIWKAANGEIPAGMLVHHKDGDRGNYALENLQLVSRREHALIHPVPPGVLSRSCREGWARRKATIDSARQNAVPAPWSPGREEVISA